MLYLKKRLRSLEEIENFINEKYEELVANDYITFYDHMPRDGAIRVILPLLTIDDAFGVGPMSMFAAPVVNIKGGKFSLWYQAYGFQNRTCSDFIVFLRQAEKEPLAEKEILEILYREYLEETLNHE